MPTADEPRVMLRLSHELHGRLRQRAKDRGVTMSVVVREALEAALGGGRGGSDRGGDGAGSSPARPAPPRAPAGRLIDFATWLSGRTGMPKAYCAAAIERGQVRIAGSQYTDALVPPDILLDVTLAGAPV